MLDFNIPEILKKSGNIAIVGLSPKTARPSYQVAEYLLQAGYNIFPVNPGQQKILGRNCYPDLDSIHEKIDIVNIFRSPKYVPAIVEDAIRLKIGVIWMQQGIVHEEAAKRAKNAGVQVVMDRCIKVDHMNLDS